MRTRTAEGGGFDKQSHAQEFIPSMAVGYIK
jgi:hypothetical protein